MKHSRAVIVVFAGIAGFSPLLKAASATAAPDFIEIAMVANAEAGTVVLVDVAARSVLGVVDVNPEHARSEGPGRPNFAQDTDVSPDGRTLYVSRCYLGEVRSGEIGDTLSGDIGYT
jgi:hypothetical protein